jgi:sec-independent protein translocase protein TatB
MFDIGWSELVVIGVVALIAIGPKELPGVLRSVGQWMTKIRSMASEFQGQFQEAMREAEMADLKKEVDTITGNINTAFDPLKNVDSNWSPDSSPSSDVTSTAADAASPPAEDVASTSGFVATPAETPEPSAPLVEPTIAEPGIAETTISEPPPSPAGDTPSAEAGKP